MGKEVDNAARNYVFAILAFSAICLLLMSRL
jgi:hypothetical protein